MKRLLAAALIGGAVMAGVAGAAKEKPVPMSAFRKYIWGARKAFELRDFKRAQTLLQSYKAQGSPTDKLVVQGGCDIKGEVKRLSGDIKTAQDCMRKRPKGKFWKSDQIETAKREVLAALSSGNIYPIVPFMDCGLKDLTAPMNACGSTHVPVPADVSRLASALQSQPDVLDRPNWREFRIDPKDPVRVRWVLHSYWDKWRPCGIEAAPIISLRQEKNGEIRIAGFAASCLGTAP